MKMKTLLEKFSYFFQSAVVTLIAALFVTSVVYAATTIGANVNTGGNLQVDGSATSTSLYLSNDLTVGGNASTTGDLFVHGGTFSLSTGTPTTTAGLFAGPVGDTSTTTIGVGSQGQNGCLELPHDGTFYRIYPNEAGTGLVVEAGRCN